MRFHSQQTPSKPFHNMSAMIDIVFLLLVFFMLTLHIAGPEGVHEVTAVADEPGLGTAVIPEVRVRLNSATDGSLALVALNGHEIGRGEEGLKSLGREVQYLCEVLGPEHAGETRIVIETDYNLKYEYSVRAVGLCSSRRSSDGRLIPLGPNVQLTSVRGLAIE